MRATSWLKASLVAMAFGGVVGAQAGPGLATSLGVSVYPAKGQPPSLQQEDEGSCYAFAKTHTGVDPMVKTNPSVVPPAEEPRGPRRRHKAEEEQASAAKAQAAVGGEQRAEFDKSFGACMKGKGYTVG